MQYGLTLRNLGRLDEAIAVLSETPVEDIVKFHEEGVPLEFATAML